MGRAVGDGHRGELPPRRTDLRRACSTRPNSSASPSPAQRPADGSSFGPDVDPDAAAELIIRRVVANLGHRAVDALAASSCRRSTPSVATGVADTVPIIGKTMDELLTIGAERAWRSTRRNCESSRPTTPISAPAADRRRTRDARPDMERALRPQDSGRRSRPTTARTARR
ncbi:MAG: hypothetical protein R2697_10945 [Ilumatobacteraceae bacterium]